jgi:filamentous hemagglutinin family protein
MKCYPLLLFLLLTTPTYAAITLDNTLNTAPINLSNYEFNETLGQRVGHHLFFSFEQFNLNQGEIATFSGESSIQNIISRVTGGQSSFINGTIRSTIPNANFYLLNPAGLQFGAEARLDIQGSFYASTAHYLDFADGGRFNAQNPQDSLLTIAPISAFGFLQAAAPIQVQGYGELSPETNLITGLRVPTGQTLSLIGGDIDIQQGSFFYDISTNSRGATVTATQRLPSLSVPDGQLNLIATKGVGTVSLNNSEIKLDNFAQLADVSIQQQSHLDVNGQGGGQIAIRAGQFILEDSVLQAHTEGNISGGKIDIQAQNIALTQSAQISTQTIGSGDAANINLQATNSFSISGKNDDSVQAYPLISKTKGAGRGGDIQIQANNINISHNDLESSADASGRGGDVKLTAQQNVTMQKAIIYVNAYSQEDDAGDSGSVFIEAQNIEMADGMINVGVFGSGQGGNIQLKATENIDLIENVHLYSDAYLGRGNGGDTIVEAKNISLKDGAFIDTTAKNSGGDAGQIILKATGTVTISGVSQEGKGKASALKSGSISLSKNEAGKGGSIQVEAENLILTDGGLITSSSDAPAWGKSSDAGHIIIRVNGETRLSGVNEFGENREGFGSGIYARTVGVENNTGKSGSIDLQTGSLTIENGGVIESSTNIAEAGGDITITVQGDVHISGDATGLVTQEAGNTQLRYLSEFSPKVYNESTSGIYARTTGNDGKAGVGGAINLSANQLTLENKGTISSSSTGDGEAGNISVAVNKLVMDDKAVITSGSQSANQYIFANESERSQQMLVSGDVVKVLDSEGNGRIAYYAHNGDDLIRINYIQSVPNMETLQDLPNQYLIRNGDVVRVEETGLKYIYEDLYGVFRVWTAFDDSQNALEFDTNAELFEKTDGWFDGVDRPVPYEYGTIMRVKDAGDGKPATYVYSGLLDPFNNYYLSRPIRLHRYEVSNMSQLQALPQQQSILNGALAVLTENQQTNYFIYNDGQWLDLYDNETHTVQDLSQFNDLNVAHTGYLTTLSDSGITEIYDGQQWLVLNETYRVNDLAQRDALPAQTGDVVTIENLGNGQTASYLYSNNQWIEQIKGGNAGQLNLTVRDGLYLSGASEITTESLSAGGGSIKINTAGVMFLENAQISTSVQEGAGHGGDLTVSEPQFLTLNKSSITAQAYRGNGGNILIVANEFIKSSDSFISASSDLGIDGNVDVTSPDNTISNNLILLSKDFLKQIEVSDPCQNYTTEFAAPLSLKANFYRYISDSLESWQPSRGDFTVHSVSCN